MFKYQNSSVVCWQGEDCEMTVTLKSTLESSVLGSCLFFWVPHLPPPSPQQSTTLTDKSDNWTTARNHSYKAQHHSMSFHKEGGDFALHQTVTVTPEVKIEGEGFGSGTHQKSCLFIRFSCLLLKFETWKFILRSMKCSSNLVNNCNSRSRGLSMN